jgi:hypothetical protein
MEWLTRQIVFLLSALLLHLRGGPLLAGTESSRATAHGTQQEEEEEGTERPPPPPPPPVLLGARRWHLPREGGQHYEMDSQEASELLLGSAASVLRALRGYRAEDAGPYSCEASGYSHSMRELGAVIAPLLTQLEPEAGGGSGSGSGSGTVGLAVPPPLSGLLYALLLSPFFVPDDAVVEVMDEGTAPAEAALHPDAAALLQLYRTRLWPALGWSDERPHTLELGAAGYQQLLCRGGGTDERGRVSLLELLGAKLGALSPPCVRCVVVEDGPLGVRWAHEGRSSAGGGESPTEARLWTVEEVQPGSQADAQVRTWCLACLTCGH